jgi:hypothetical protein
MAGSVPNADRVTESVSGAPARSPVWRRRSGSVTVALLNIGQSCAKCPTMDKVLLIGLLPSVVDLSSVPGLTEEKLAVTLTTEEQKLRDLGSDATWCLVDTGATAESVVRTALEARAYDVVLVGAGVRTIATCFLLFEKLVNLIQSRVQIPSAPLSISR